MESRRTEPSDADGLPPSDPDALPPSDDAALLPPLTDDGWLPPLPELPDDPTISVVVPARDGAASLPAAVASALEQTLPPDEVVIAVGPSADDTAAVAAELAAAHPGRVRVVDNASGRTPDALNAAIAAAHGEVIARVDTGSQLPREYLARAVEVLRRTGAANVGGRQVPHADRGFQAAVAAAMRSPFGAGGARYRSGSSERGPVDTVYLGVFRREALDIVGGFDPAFERNQDAELNIRLREAGFAVWLEPELEVRYRPRPSLRGLASQYFQYGRWRRRTVATHPGSLQPRQLAPVVLVGGLLGALGWSLLRRRPAPAAVAAGGYVAGVVAAGGQAAPDVRRWPATSLALATMHLSWGVGFLVGPPRGADEGGAAVPGGLRDPAGQGSAGQGSAGQGSAGADGTAHDEAS